MATRKISSHIVLGCDFCMFLTYSECVLVIKSRIYIKTDIRFGISVENWVVSFIFQVYLKGFIFIEKNACTPLQGTREKQYRSKLGFHSLIFCHFTSSIILLVRTFCLTEQMAFPKEIIFRGFPEGECGRFFR